MRPSFPMVHGSGAMQAAESVVDAIWKPLEDVYVTLLGEHNSPMARGVFTFAVAALALLPDDAREAGYKSRLGLCVGLGLSAALFV